MAQNKQNANAKFEDIIKAAKKLFSEQGYENTTVRQIVKEANTSMGNLYFHFPNKLSILKYMCKNYIDILRDQIPKIHELSLPPDVAYTLDLKIGYINTLENPKLFPLWLVIRRIPEIHKYSLTNKKVRLKTFFGDLKSDEELDILAIAIQGITDSFYEQKGEGKFKNSPLKVSDLILDYSLRLLGYSEQEIKNAIQEADKYIEKENITIDEYFLT